MCPFTSERLAAVPAIRPEVTIIHAQRADRKGNVLIEGIIGVQKEAAFAATNVIVTVEEVVDDLHAPSPNATILPHWTIDAIIEAPCGALPSYTHGYYRRDNAFYTAWDVISRNRETFISWMQEHVLYVHMGNISVRGTAGDHKGPPSHSSPHSPLRGYPPEMMESHRIVM